MTARISCAALCVLLSLSTPALAQEAPDDSEKARFQWGPIRFTPTLEITSLGRDSNVFNEVVESQERFHRGHRSGSQAVDEARTHPPDRHHRRPVPLLP